MRTMFLAVIASTTLMTSTACKQTETEATGTQQTELDKANAALMTIESYVVVRRQNVDSDGRILARRMLHVAPCAPSAASTTSTSSAS